MYIYIYTDRHTFSTQTYRYLCLEHRNLLLELFYLFLLLFFVAVKFRNYSSNLQKPELDSKNYCGIYSCNDLL